MEVLEMIFSLLGSVIELLFNVFNFLLASFVNGIRFFASTFTSIPNLIFELLYELPDFFRIGLTGVFGLLLVVVFFKLLVLFKII